MSQFNSSQPPPASSAKLVIVAVVLAIVAAVLVNVYIEMVKRENAAQSFEVYRLTRSVQRSEKLRRTDVEAHRVPNEFKASFPDAITDPDALQNHLEMAFQMDVPSNAVLTRTHFLTSGSEADDQKILEGYRRIWLPVNSKNVPGGLAPGVFVDIAAPFSDGGVIPNVLPVMEVVKVVAVGERTITDATATGAARGQSRSYQGISIDVTPEEAIELAKIQMLAAGEFILFLRNPGDTKRPVLKAGGINEQVKALVNKRMGLPATAGP